MNQRSPSSLQIELLKLLLKFRFSTITLLARHKNIKNTTIDNSIKSLQSKKLISKKYDASYKLAGRGAEYYLTNNGINYLRHNFDLYESALHSMYKNKTLSQTFISKCLLIHQLYLHLRDQHPLLTIFTKTEMLVSNNLPKPYPDLYFKNEEQDYLLDVFTENLFFYVKKRVDKLIAHHESEEWPESTPPVIMLVLPSISLEDKARNYIVKTKDDNYIDDDELVFMTTPLKTLLDSTSKDVWTIVGTKKREEL